MSSFKALVAAMLLAEVGAGRRRLDDDIRFGPDDLLAASPVTTENVAAGRMSVAALAAAMMARSDNAAANLLMRWLGGPPAVTRYLRSIGDPVTRIDHYEGPLLARASMPADSSTPAATADTIRRLLTGRVLAPAERRQWEAWMASNVVGRTRLRAAFPADWAAGDRTGTADGICNDIAFARAPGHAPLVIACFHEAPDAELPTQEATLRAVGEAVVDWWRES